MPPAGPGRTAACTASALIAFAGNSVLCRVALGRAAIDAATFSTVRVIAGAATLLLIVKLTRSRQEQAGGSWLSAILLFAYAVPFSFAYLSLSVGTGALILFGSVQLTLMLVALASGERPHATQWAGLLLACGGLVYLMFPGLEAPSPSGGALMATAGVSWGIYTLRGRGSPDPLAETSGNFLRAVPFAILISLIVPVPVHLETSGLLLAIVSGALTSGVGYVLWYIALRELTAIRAAVVQLVVPVLAACGGVMFIGERLTFRLTLAGTIVLAGTALALLGRERILLRRASHL